MGILQPSHYRRLRQIEEISLILLISFFLFTFGVLLLHVLDIRPLGAFKSGVFANLTFLQFMVLLIWPLLSVSQKSQAMRQGERVETSALPTRQHPVTERRKVSNELRVWSMDDPRVEAGLFHLALPAFVVNAEFKFVDWSVAFSLIFEKELGLAKGDGLDKWYAAIDNFKMVQQRSEQQDDLILAMIDRQRVVYHSVFFGKMVFHHFLSPVVDRKTAKVIGWQVVLNLHSVNQRKMYLDLLHVRREYQINATRYAASLDSIYSKSRTFKALTRRMLAFGQKDYSSPYFSEIDSALVVGSEFPSLLRALATRTSLSVLDDQSLFLRQAKYLLAGLQRQVRFVRKSLNDLESVPSGRFDCVYVCFSHLRVKDIGHFLQCLRTSLKVGGKIIIVNWRIDTEFTQAATALRAELEEDGYYDELKYQVEQWSSYLEERVQRRGISREAIRGALLEHHFEITEDCFDFQHLGVDLLVARAY